MKSRISTILTLLLIGFYSSVLAQQYRTGLILDDDAYDETPKKALLLSRGYSVLPKKVSLKEYAPTPMDQGPYGTCVGWSTAWAARTIVEAKKHGWTDQETIDKNAFSPHYIYSMVKSSKDTECKNGAIISKALRTMMEKGIAQYSEYNVDCPEKIPESIVNKAEPNKIKDYMRLFGREDRQSTKVMTVQKALKEGNPVVIGMKCPDSFFNTAGVWKPIEDPEGPIPGHAMCVIGYDSEKYGGAFEIMNSWGTNWGNEGFIWITYEDFGKFVKYGYEIFPNPEIKPAVPDLSGELAFNLANGDDMNAAFTGNARGFSVVSAEGNSDIKTQYKMKKGYKSGTQFRFYITNHEPAYVYAIGSDATEKVFQIFPYTDEISPALTYDSSSVAIPDEEHYIQMDETVGTDYFCVLYSKDALDIATISKQIEAESGTFAQRISKVLADKLVSDKDIVYNTDKVAFEAFSKDKTVVPIMLEMEHLK